MRITNGILEGRKNQPGDYGYMNLYYSLYAQRGLTITGPFVETTLEQEGKKYFSGTVLWSGRKGEQPFVRRRGWHTFTTKWPNV